MNINVIAITTFAILGLTIPSPAPAYSAALDGLQTALSFSLARSHAPKPSAESDLCRSCEGGFRTDQRTDVSPDAAPRAGLEGAAEPSKAAPEALDNAHNCNQSAARNLRRRPLPATSAAWPDGMSALLAFALASTALGAGPAPPGPVAALAVLRWAQAIAPLSQSAVR